MNRRFWLFVGIAAVLKLLFVWLTRDSPFVLSLSGDEREYYQEAVEILRTGLIGKDAFYFAPLYPYLLAGFFSIFGTASLVGVRILQALLGALNVGVMYRLGREALGSKAAGTAAAVLTMFCGTYYFLEVLIHKETLSILLGNVALLVMLPSLKSKSNSEDSSAILRCAGAGLLFGATVHLRGNNLVLIAALAVFLGAKALKKTLPAQALATFVAGVAIAIAPATIHNAIASGDFVLTTYYGGANFYIGNHAGADGGYVPLRPRRQTATLEKADAREMAEAEFHRSLRPSEIDAYWRGRAFAFIERNPLAFLSLTARKMMLLHSNREMGDTTYYRHFTEQYPVMIVLFSSWPLILGLALPGLVLGFANRRGLAWLYLTLGASVLSVVLFFVMSRYKAPLIGLYILFGAYAIARAREWAKERSFYRVAAVFGSAVIIVIAIGHGETAAKTGAEYNNLGIKLQQLSRLAEAKTNFASAVRTEPNDALFRANYARLLEATHEPEDAAAEWRTALALLSSEASNRTDAVWNDEVVTALTSLIRLYSQLGHETEASALRPRLAEERRKLVDRLMQQPRPDADMYAKIGENSRELQDFDAARKAYGKALELSPQNNAWLVDAGLVEVSLQNFEAAEKLFLRALQINPTNAFTHKLLGNVHYMQKRFEDTATEWATSLKLNPKDDELRRQRDQLLAALPK